ncbi:MAG: RagB/SusD family nutrient uptake outer membrane protein [Prevotellaceae bacterium]|jgi:hypothetical protein|nr:RagB/SusD family nutrient uptake outer membrane protein [Prevotellaceae bacterium]
MKKIPYIIAMVTFSLVTVSCSEDFLEVDHYGIVEPEVLLSSQKYVEQGLNGVYDLLYPESISGDNVSQTWLLKPHLAMANYPTLDIQADGWDVDFNRQAWKTTQAEFIGGWTRAYTAIDRANRFLANLQKADPMIFQGGEATMKIIEAQARALRAYFYTWLVQNFGGVPMLVTGETYSSNPGKERGTAEEAWSVIIGDLEYARDILDWTPWNNQKGRVTKGMAKAYLAQAYMYMANINNRATWFGKAKTELKDIIDDGPYQLNPCFGQIHIPGVYWQPESIWEIAFPEWSNMTQTGTQTDAVWFPVQQKGAKEYGGWGPHYVSYEFCWSFEPGDKRLNYEVARYGEKNEFVMKHVEGGTPDMNSPPDYQDYSWFPGGCALYGFCENKGGLGPNFGLVGLQSGWRSAFITTDNMPNNSDKKLWKEHVNYNGRRYTSLSSIQIRLAAVYLNYAECCFETGDASTGWEYIQKIRDRAWGALESAAPATMEGDVFKGKIFPFTLGGPTAPDAQTFYNQYKRSSGKIQGTLKRLVGEVDALTPIYGQTTYVGHDYTPYTAEAWKVALLIERRHEFFSEYSLWYDICRMGIAQQYLDAEYPYNNEDVRFEEIPGYLQSDRYVPNPHTKRDFQHNPNRELYPIPYDELVKNPALTLEDQNPGY